MRIRKLQLVGLAAVLAGGVSAPDARAGDVTITTSTSAPLVTSSPDGVSPGDVTVGSGGSITVGAGETAITVDSGNDVTVQSGGALASNDADNSTGILLQGGQPGTLTITNSGAIRLLEDHTMEDADDDGDLDGEFAIGTNRHGIFLQAGPAFTGSIVNGGSITIEGEDSSAIRLDALLDGDLTSTGPINVTGDNSNGIAITGGPAAGVTGDVVSRSSMTIRGEGANAILVDGVIGGELRVNGTISVSGYHSLAAPADPSDLDADDLLQGGSAVAVHQSVLGGVTIEGLGVENDPDDDGDGILDDAATDPDTDDDLTASLTTHGSAPTILIEADPADDLTLGAGASGYGLHVRGSVAGIGVYDGIEATAIRIAGDSGGSTATIDGGVAIDGVVSASAVEADSHAIAVGENAIVPEIVVRRSLASVSGGDGAFTAHGVLIESGADVAALSNSGVMRAQFFGETGDAVVIRDQSDTLAAITNTGTIQAQVIATDDDPADGVPPPPVTGSAIAIDVSASTIDVTLTQTADVPFTDDDAIDDDAESRPDIAIYGDILFGAGNDTFDLLAGEVRGDLSFGAGNDTFTIDNGATYFGRLTDADGVLDITVTDGILALNGGTTEISSASFGADGVLGVFLSDAPAETTFIHASGQVTFADGATIAPIVPTGLPDSGSYLFLTADGGLVGEEYVTGAVDAEGSPFLYNLSINVAGGDPNSLEAAFIMKSAAQLGLTPNQTVAFAPIIEALRLDDDAAAAMSSIDAEFDFFDAFEDLMPSYAGGATEVAATAIQQMQGATSNRLAATRLQDLDDVSVWAQEIAYGLDRQPPSANGQEFRGQGFGFAFGIDGPLDNGALFGLSASFIASEVEEPGRPEGEISAWFGQANAYLGTAMGPIDLDFIAGAGAGKLQSRRFVRIGDDFSALSEADWWGFEGHGSVRASAPMSLGESFVITPQAALTYVALHENGYTESGGGPAIDYDVDDAFSQRLWGDVGVEFSARWRLRSGGVIAPRIFGGYRANLIDEEAERTVRFAAGGSDFTLVDEGLGDGAPLVGIGFDATNGFSTFSLGYEGELGDQIERHSLNAAIRFRF